LTHCGQSILRKISKFDATTNQILRLKCTKLDFRWRSAPDPTGGAYSAPPDPVSVFQAAYFLQEERGGGGKGKRAEKERGMGGKRGGVREGPGPQIFWRRTPPRPCDRGKHKKNGKA